MFCDFNHEHHEVRRLPLSGSDAGVWVCPGHYEREQAFWARQGLVVPPWETLPLQEDDEHVENV